MASRVTLKDIAREANVSVGLASKALSRYPEVSEDMQRRIQRISKRLGYRPRRRRITPNEAAASAPRPRRVCLTFLDGRSAASAYTRHWVRELSLAAGRQDMRLEVVVIESDDAPSCGDELRRCAEDVDGMLLLGFIRTGIGSIIRDIGKSCLAIGDFEPGPRPVTHQVNIDKREMAYSATRALLDAGHRRIGFFATASQPGGWNEQWLNGYRLALMQADIPDDPAVRPVFDLTDRSALGVQAAAHMAALTPRPSAYVVPEVSLAMHFRHAMAEHGITLESHQMVVGGDREEAEQFGVGDYPLFSEDIVSAAAHAINLLQRLAQHEPVPPVQAMVPCQTHNLERLLRKDHP